MIKEDEKCYDIYKIDTNEKLDKRKVLIIIIAILILFCLIIILKNLIEAIKYNKIYKQYEEQITTMQAAEANKNIKTEEEKERINQKKLCRIMGAGLLPIAVLILVMDVFFDTLPSFFVYIFVSFTLLDAVMIIVLANTKTKK